jgi:Cof subfamily protein (haloacid dehalogenase superfamily)
MNNKFEGFLLMSDMDGTLLAEDNKVPKRNIEGIYYFVKHGGLFSIATGRSHLSLAARVQSLYVNAPCVVLNGCAIYDYDNTCFFHEAYLTDHVREVVGMLYKKIPEAVPIIFVQSGMFCPVNLKDLDPCFDTATVPLRNANISDIKENWFKVVFIGEHETLKKVREYTQCMKIKDTESVFSGYNMFELLPTGVSKGAGFLKLANSLDIPLSRTAAIGDYYNDMEMLRYAGISATTAQAPDELKEEAKYTVCHCNYGSVGDFIELLDQRL